MQAHLVEVWGRLVVWDAQAGGMAGCLLEEQVSALALGREPSIRHIFPRSAVFGHCSRHWEHSSVEGSVLERGHSLLL